MREYAKLTEDKILGVNVHVVTKGDVVKRFLFKKRAIRYILYS